MATRPYIVSFSLILYLSYYLASFLITPIIPHYRKTWYAFCIIQHQKMYYYHIISFARTLVSRNARAKMVSCICVRVFTCVCVCVRNFAGNIGYKQRFHQASGRVSPCPSSYLPLKSAGILFSLPSPPLIFRCRFEIVIARRRYPPSLRFVSTRYSFSAQFDARHRRQDREIVRTIAR